MDLQTHLRDYLGDEYFNRTQSENTLHLRCTRYEVITEVVGTEFWIRYLRVTDPGNRFGDEVVEALLAFCRSNRLTPFVRFPEDRYTRFWQRNGFEPEPDDDEKWRHEEWS